MRIATTAKTRLVRAGLHSDFRIHMWTALPNRPEESPAETPGDGSGESGSCTTIAPPFGLRLRSRGRGRASPPGQSRPRSPLDTSNRLTASSTATTTRGAM